MRKKRDFLCRTITNNLHTQVTPKKGKAQLSTFKMCTEQGDFPHVSTIQEGTKSNFTVEMPHKHCLQTDDQG